MRNVLLATRWLAVSAAVFFVFSLLTGIAREVAVAALFVAVVAVIVVSVVDLTVRRR